MESWSLRKVGIKKPLTPPSNERHIKTNLIKVYQKRKMNRNGE